MKTNRTRLKWGVAALAFLLVGLLGWGFLLLSGIKGFYVDHVIATFEITGIETQSEANQLNLWFQNFPGIRHTTLARRSLANNVWMARVQFAASNAASGQQQIQDWIQSVQPPPKLHLVKAVYYEYRIYRPGRGDIVLGLPQPIAVQAL